MSNLIPPQGQTALKREYIARVFSVHAVLLGGTFVALTLCMLPLYVTLDNRASIIEETYVSETDVEQAFLQVKDVISEANAVVSKLSEFPKSYSVTEIIKEIEKSKQPGITIETYQVPTVTLPNKYAPATDSSEANYVVNIRGLATSRVALASFKEALEQSEYFTSAAVPLSDLAQNANLPFTITLTLESSRLLEI